MKTTHETDVTETENPNVVLLDTPLMRGEQKIEKVTLSKPNAGTLRGVALAALAQYDVDALIKVLPRMTYPSLTEAEIIRLDASDLLSFAGNGIKGSMAGTGASAIFNRLQAPMGKAVAAVSELGVKIRDDITQILAVG